METNLFEGRDSLKFSAELSAIFENAMVVLILVNNEGKVVNINRTGLEFTAKEKSQVLNRLGGDVFNCINSWSDGKVVCGTGDNCSECFIRKRVNNTFKTGETHYKEEGYLDVLADNKKERLELQLSTSLIAIDGNNYTLLTIDDITQQKKAQLELKESQKQYKFVNDNISDVVWMADINMNLTHVSPSVYNLTGYTVEETLKLNAVDSFHTGDAADLLHDLLNKKLNDIKNENPQGWEPFTIDVKLQKKDLSYIWSQESMSIIKGPDGKPQSVMGTSRDITKQKKAAIALEQSEQKFKDTFKYSGVGMVLASLDGTFLTINKAACHIFGYTENELLCKNFRDITHPDDVENNLELLDQLLGGDIKFYHLEKRYITKSGNTAWANLYVTLVRGVNNEPLYLNTQIVDITPRMIYQQELLEEKKKIAVKESHYRALFEESFDAVILRKDYKAIDCNQAAVDMLGYDSKQELLNHRPEDVSPEYQPDGQLSKNKATYYTQLALTMGQSSFDWLFKTKTGLEKWANVAITRFEIDGEIYSYSIWRDISIRKKQELELKSMSAKLAKAQSLASIGYFEFFIGDKYAKGSDAYYNIYGIKPAQHTRKDFLDVVSPEDRERVMTIQGNAQKGDGSYEIKYRIKTPSGIHKYIHEIGEFKFDKNNRPTYLLGMVHDITKEHEAELQLKSLSNKLIKAQKIGLVGNFEWFKETDYVTGSDEYFKIFRSTPEKHKSFDDFIKTVHTEDRERVHRALDYAIKNNEFYNVEYRLTFNDNIIKYIHAIGEFEFDTNGNATYLLGLVRDITELKEAEQKVRESELLLKNIFNTSQVGITLNKNRVIVFANPYICSLLNYKPEEVINKDSIDFYPTVEEYELVGKNIEDGLKIKNKVSQESRLKTKSGDIIHIQMNSSFFNGQNESDGIISVITDITELKRTETALRDSEDRYKTIFKNSGDPVLILEDGNIIDCNQATIDVLKIKSKKEIQKIKIFELSPPYQPDGILSIIKGPQMIEATLKKGFHEFDWVHQNKKGQDLWFNIQLIKIYLNHKEVIYARWHDISKRKLAESKLTKSIDARNKFISVLAHDLRGMIGGNIPLIGLIEANGKQWDRRDEITSHIFKNINSSFDMLNSLVTWGKTTLLNERAQLSQFNIFNLFEELKTLCSSRLQLKDITLHTLCLDKQMITADKHMIESTIRNLVTNAIKYSHNGGNIYCNCLQKENELEISIADEGVGMAKEQIEQLFELNNTTSIKGTAGEVGSGLGLQIAKEYVEKHGGKLWAESEPDKGSVFKFNIPLNPK
ncbi:PAS domain S-box protein [Carboxylicivirga sp. M1479]|uniref:PAS domain S-box protein n=1 Tax=Carboxylicivirga sp. M1479 TaxID=2594476 RepID=UPI001177981A|nr:PAS domain S-box protein [Carboxylicivirga sp. M1479]TRX71950.1 PAS domain S-box protein [Carboxylicivirga sp. M1479]